MVSFAIATVAVFAFAQDGSAQVEFGAFKGTVTAFDLFQAGEAGQLKFTGEYETLFNTSDRDIVERYGLVVKVNLNVKHEDDPDHVARAIPVSLFVVSDTVEKPGLAGVSPCGLFPLTSLGVKFLSTSSTEKIVTAQANKILAVIKIVEDGTNKKVTGHRVVTRRETAFDAALHVKLSGPCRGGDPASDSDDLYALGTVSLDRHGDSHPSGEPLKMRQLEFPLTIPDEMFHADPNFK